MESCKRDGVEESKHISFVNGYRLTIFPGMVAHDLGTST